MAFKLFHRTVVLGLLAFSSAHSGAASITIVPASAPDLTAFDIQPIPWPAAVWLFSAALAALAALGLPRAT